MQPAAPLAPPPRKRSRLLLGLALASLGLGAGLGWLVGSESGLQTTLALASGLSGGQFQASGARGRLVGPLEVEQLEWQAPDLKLRLQDLALDWQPLALAGGELRVERLEAASLLVASQPGPARPAPLQIELPLAARFEQVRLERFSLATLERFQAPATPLFEHLEARLESDGRLHRLEQLRLRLAGLQLEAQARLEGSGELPLQAELHLAGQVEGHPMRLQLQADGPLANLPVTGQVEGDGARGSLSGRLNPFSPQPVGRLEARLAGIDPARWQPGAPSGDLTLEMDLLPREGPLAGAQGQFRLTNGNPGRLDQQRLPLETLQGRLDWEAGVLRLDDLEAGLAAGQARGKGHYAEGRLELELDLQGVDLARLHERLLPTRLEGRLQGSLGGADQHLEARLRDPRFQFAARVEHQGSRVELRQLELEGQGARLEAQASLDLDAPRAFAAQGRLERFNPARFARLPQASISGSFKGQGQWTETPELQLELALADSQVAGKPFGGSARLDLAGERLKALAADLRAGDNRLQAQGALGRPEDRLQLEISAPRLADLGLEGDLEAHLELAGALTLPQVSGSIASRHLALPGLATLKGLTLETRMGSRPADPLQLKAQLAQLDLPGQPRLLQQANLMVDGSRQQHRLQLDSQLALAAPAALREASLSLAAGGGIKGDAWEGLLESLSLAPRGKPALVSLAAPAPLTLGPARLRLGNAQLKGDTWEAKLAELSLQAGTWSSSGQLQRFPLALALPPGLAGNLRVNGDWNLGLGPRNRGSLDLARADGDIVLGRGETASLGLSEARLSLNLDNGPRLQLQARGTRLGEVQGQLQLDAQAPLERPWSGRVSAHMADIGWAARLAGDALQLGGQVQGELDLAGTPRQPRLSGQVKGSGLHLRTLATGMRLESGQLSLRFDGETLHLEQLSFVSPLTPPSRRLERPLQDKLGAIAASPGRIEGSGQIRINDQQGHLEIRLDRLGVMQKPDQWVALSGQGQLGLAGSRLNVGAKLKVDGAWWQLADLGAPRLSDDVVVRRGGAGAPPERDKGLIPAVDVSIDLGDAFHFAGAGVFSRLAGSLRLQGEGSDTPRASGTIRTVDGQFDAYGQHLSIDQGILTFNGLLANPALNIRATRKGLPVEAGVMVTGTARKPLVKLVSEPNVPDPEKLSWLIMGEAPEQQSGRDYSTLLSAASTILGGSASSGGVIRQLKQTLGIDELAVTSGSINGGNASMPTSQVASSRGFDAGSQSSTGQIVRVGTHLASNLSLSYEQSLASTESVVKLTLALSRNLSLVGQAGTDNALDIFYTFRFGKSAP